jgi:hypothetical protein
MHPQRVHPSDIEQQRSSLYISIHYVLNPLETTDERSGPVLTRNLHCGGNLQQQGMHGIAELVSGDREEFVASLELLL